MKLNSQANAGEPHERRKPDPDSAASEPASASPPRSVRTDVRVDDASGVVAVGSRAGARAFCCAVAMVVKRYCAAWDFEIRNTAPTGSSELKMIVPSGAS